MANQPLYGFATTGSGGNSVDLTGLLTPPSEPPAGYTVNNPPTYGDILVYDGVQYQVGIIHNSTQYVAGSADPGPGQPADGFFAYKIVGGVPDTTHIYFFSTTVTALESEGADDNTQYFNSNPSSPPFVCFMAGTDVRISATDSVPVETLAIGDMVLTSDGRTTPVLWIGRQTASTLFADPLRVLPIRVKAGALGEGLPVRDLLVSPRHALLVDGMLVEAAALVNGSSIVRERNVPAVFTYYHVETEDHALILAEGVPAETFVDNASRENFDNWAEHQALFPQGRPVMEMAYPRAQSARQVPASVQRRLDAIAQAMGDALSQAA